jgi:pimeloyl-ACP methyl ester carboxylesterase
MGAAHNTFDHLGQVACPTVVARGVDVPVGPAHFAAAVADAIPAAQLVTYDDLGHFGPLEDPGRIAADIARFARDHGQLRDA